MKAGFDVLDELLYYAGEALTRDGYDTNRLPFIFYDLIIL
jgi:hypothetical protein